MVSTTVDNLSDEFETVVEDRDVAGAATIGLAGAGGGVVATQLAGRIAPLLGFPAQPSGSSGLLLNGTIKMLVGAALGFAAARVGGTAGLILGVAGVGGLILGGGDWINAALSTDVGVPGASPSRGNAMPMNQSGGAARVVGTQTDDDFEFRQTAENGSTATASAGGNATFR